jgi:hypothetical protein
MADSHRRVLITKSRTAKTEKLAEQSGMTPEGWSNARKQASAARTRGRRAEATVEKKLANWGTVESQMPLFDVDE